MLDKKLRKEDKSMSECKYIHNLRFLIWFSCGIKWQKSNPKKIQKYHLLLYFSVSILFFYALYPFSAQSTEIWIAGIDPSVRKIKYNQSRHEYIDSFRSDLVQSEFAGVSVFKSPTQWISNATDEELLVMIAGLRQAGVKLAVEGLATPIGDDGCGRGIEGFSKSGSMAKILQRVKSLGGEVSYVALDEPFWYGSHFRGYRACSYDLRRLAGLISLEIKYMRDVFPNIKVGVIEPVRIDSRNRDIVYIKNWLTSFRDISGFDFDFFHADMYWNSDSLSKVPELAKYLAERGIAFGVIYNGDNSSATDEAWIDLAESRFSDLEGERSTVPDHAILQSWDRRPVRFGPRKADNSLISLIDRYQKTRTSLSCYVGSGGVEGKLQSHGGSANNLVLLFGNQKFDEYVDNTLQMEGRVPSNAFQIQFILNFVIRCDCDHRSKIKIPLISFTDNQENKFNDTISLNLNNFVDERFFTNGDNLEIRSEKIRIRSNSFYQVEIMLATLGYYANIGSLHVVFYGSQGDEIARSKIALSSKYVVVGSRITDPEGKFRFDSPSVGNKSIKHIKFPGNDSMRRALCMLPQ
jgi:hypothetical protein